MPESLKEDRTRKHARIAHELAVQHFHQPDDVTCGPTCLMKVYDYYGLEIDLDEILGEIDRNEDGGTLAVFLANSAITRGFSARLYSYDLRIFDPSWASLHPSDVSDRLRRRIPYLQLPKAIRAAESYLSFMEMGGEIAFDELTPGLLKRILNRDHPVLAGLSATYLYRMKRERHDPDTHALLEDDIRGQAIGHFVVIAGYDHWGRRFTVRDPSEHVPEAADGRQVVDANRLINSILLGDLTSDAVLLEIWREDEVRAS